MGIEGGCGSTPSNPSKKDPVRLKHLLIPHGEHLKVPPSLPELLQLLCCRELQFGYVHVRHPQTLLSATILISSQASRSRAGRRFQPAFTDPSSTCDPAGGSSVTVSPRLLPLWLQSPLNFDSSGSQRLIQGSSRWCPPTVVVVQADLLKASTVQRSGRASTMPPRHFRIPNHKRIQNVLDIYR